jgi:hypothetical protein
LYKKVFLVGAYAPVSGAPEGERELFLRNLQAVVESAEREEKKHVQKWAGSRR